jgi:RloB-like protein
MRSRRRDRERSPWLRRSGNEKPGHSILIVCEGARTEPLYFEGLWKAIRLASVEVRVVGQGAEIVGVVEEAIHRRVEREREAAESLTIVPFDEVWCVVDTECRNDNPSWERGVDRARANGLNLAWSNPCFEFWLLLHFELIGRSFAGYAAVRPFLARHIKHYKKNTDCFDQLAPRIPTAIDHSKRIHRSQWQDTPRSIDCNPATAVHELVERLLAVAGMTVDDYRQRFPLPDEDPPKGKRTRRS